MGGQRRGHRAADRRCGHVDDPQRRRQRHHLGDGVAVRQSGRAVPQRCVGHRTPSATALPPETITSVTPTPTAAPPSAIAEPTEAAPPPAADPRTVTYTVTGNRQLFDLVTIIYTDQQGALQTDVNVALPWTKQVTLDPGVELSSVTATSVAGQLNCSITDAGGRDAGGAEQQHDDRELHPLSRRQARPSSCMRVLCVCCSRSKNSVSWPSPSVPDTTRSTSSSWSASTNWAWVMASPSSRRDHSASRCRCLLAGGDRGAHLGDDEL